MEQYFALIVAAGLGARFGGTVPKQYHHLKEKTVIEYAVAPFLEAEWIQKIVLVVAPDTSFVKSLGFIRDPKVMMVMGGPHRQHSVRNGLLALQPLAKEKDWVLVHDAARPCLSLTEIERLKDVLQEDPIGGLLVAPVVETMKRIRHDKVIATVPKEELVRALTPQQFRYGLLLQAVEAAISEDRVVTDEANSLEALGLHPTAVMGDVRNIKITYPEDLKIAETFL